MRSHSGWQASTGQASSAAAARRTAPSLQLCGLTDSLPLRSADASALGVRMLNSDNAAARLVVDKG